MKKYVISTIGGLLAIALLIFSLKTLWPLSPEKLIAQQETSLPVGTVSRVAFDLSPSVVGVVSYGEEGDFFTRREVQKSGSGVIVDEKGFIVTNNHVVSDAKRIYVILSNGKEVRAKLIGGDARTDLALLKVDGQTMKPARLGDSDRLVVGESVVAIGNPMGQRFARSVTAGVISGLNRLLTTEEGYVFRLIQTDAAINPGNSGGALANLKGEVIGINTIKIAVSGFEGMGFAIPSNQVKDVIAQLRNNGRVIRPVAGVKIVDEVTPERAKYYNLPVDYGVAVMPLKGSKAAKAGIKDYDIITAVNGHRIKSAAELQECIFGCKVGDYVTLKVARINRSSDRTCRHFNIRVQLDGE